MSTQRRANRITPATEIDRADVRRRWFRGCGGRAGNTIPETRTGSKLASVSTAPLMSIIWLAWAWLFSCDVLSQGTANRVATNSLLSDHCNETFAGLGSLFGSPPRDGVGGRRLLGSAGYAQVIPSAHSRPIRPHASPPHLAAGPSRRNPLGGKARWQKRFVFPARRMRRGLQF